MSPEHSDLLIWQQSAEAEGSDWVRTPKVKLEKCNSWRQPPEAVAVSALYGNSLCFQPEAVPALQPSQRSYWPEPWPLCLNRVFSTEQRSVHWVYRHEEASGSRSMRNLADLTWKVLLLGSQLPAGLLLLDLLGSLSADTERAETSDLPTELTAASASLWWPVHLSWGLRALSRITEPAQRPELWGALLS